MAKIKIFLKNKKDIPTPNVIELSESKIQALVGGNIDNDAIISNIFREQPVVDSIYLIIIIDSRKNIESENYDYYLKCVNEIESNFLISGDETDGFLKINSSLMFNKSVNNDAVGFYKLKALKGIDFQTTGREGEEIFAPHIYLKKTLKDRPERCRGESDVLSKLTIRNIIIKEK